MKQKNSIIIISGGMDSVTLLYDQKDYIALAVTFDYGSNHNKREAELAAYRANFYLASANAVTEHGEIYQVDGNSNRISALAYGPERVILVVGKNKIVKDLRSAVERVKRYAAPANATRFGKGCFCEKAGHCIQKDFDENHLMCAAHCGEDTICRNTLIMSKQKSNERITVIIVGEDLGY